MLKRKERKKKNQHLLLFSGVVMLRSGLPHGNDFNDKPDYDDDDDDDMTVFDLCRS